MHLLEKALFAFFAAVIFIMIGTEVAAQENQSPSMNPSWYDRGRERILEKYFNDSSNTADVKIQVPDVVPPEPPVENPGECIKHTEKCVVPPTGKQ